MFLWFFCLFGSRLFLGYRLWNFGIPSEQRGRIFHPWNNRQRIRRRSMSPFPLHSTRIPSPIIHPMFPSLLRRIQFSSGRLLGSSIRRPDRNRGSDRFPIERPPSLDFIPFLGQGAFLPAAFVLSCGNRDRRRVADREIEQQPIICHVVKLSQKSFSELMIGRNFSGIILPRPPASAAFC